MIIKCKICGNEFNKTATQLCCSLECRRINRANSDKEWALKNKDKVKANSKTYHKKNPNAKRGSHFKHRYGLTLEQYDQMVIDQESKCKVCKKQPDLLYVDHCHKTGKVRGLLCNGCNRGLGFFSENAEALIKAAEYIKEHNDD